MAKWKDNVTALNDRSNDGSNDPYGQMVSEVVDLIRQNKIKAPPHELIPLFTGDSEEISESDMKAAQQTLVKAVERSQQPFISAKQILTFE